MCTSFLYVQVVYASFADRKYGHTVTSTEDSPRPDTEWKCVMCVCVHVCVHGSSTCMCIVVNNSDT